MLAFVLLASRFAIPVEQADVRRCTRYDAAELAFEPDQYLGWHSNDRRLYLFAWQAFAEQGQIGSHWAIDRDRVVLFSGMPVPLDRPWVSGRSWADQIAESIDMSDAGAVAAELGGAFTLLDLHAEGDSIAINDPMGGATLYTYMSESLLIISNRANLAASSAGGRILRDWRGPAWPLYAGEPHGYETGFKGIQAMPPGDWWHLGWKKRPERKHRVLEDSLPAGNEIDRIETALRRSLRSIASLPFQQCSLVLDGGKASRLLLGLLHAENLLDRVALTVQGDTGDPAVEIAAQLADLVDRPLAIEPRSLPSASAFEEQARIHVFQTSGVGSLWELQGRLGIPDEVRIEASLAGMLTSEGVRRAFPDEQSAFDPAGIVPETVAAHLADRWESANAEHSGIAPCAANPRSIAALVETPVPARAFPFLDPAIHRALQALERPALADEIPWKTILQRTAPELLNVRCLDEIDPQDSRVAYVDQILSVLEDYLRDPANPVQDLFESERLSALISDPARSPESARALYDLLTIAIWLGRDEEARRVHRADELGVCGYFSPLDQLEPMLLGSPDRFPQPNPAVRHRATDQLLDFSLKRDEEGVRLTHDARVLGVIPHFDAEHYLEAAIDSLVRQTRPLQGIVVIDDCSPTPPTRLIEKFPGVTFLKSSENSGPYRLIQEVIDNVDYDAILFQDSDDWSAPQRLDVLLDIAVRTGKELIGSQGHRLIKDEGEVVTYQHPFDPERSFQESPKSKPVHHPTTLVTRDLIQRSGGFATGLPYSGDTEFLRRAATIGPIGNTREFVYVYRTRGDSLTGSEETGVHTAVRQALWAIQHPRAVWISERVAAGLGPVLAPMAVTSPVGIEYLSGPPLTGIDGTPWPPSADRSVRFEPIRTSTSRDVEPSIPPRPVFLIGAPRSGTSLLALAIAQLPNLSLILDPNWLPTFAAALHSAFPISGNEDSINDLIVRRIETEEFAAHFGAAAYRLLLDGLDPKTVLHDPSSLEHPETFGNWKGATRIVAEGSDLASKAYGLYRLFPQARFIHVVRDPDEVVATFQDGRYRLYRSRFVQMDEDNVYDSWIEAVSAARQLESALGADQVMRVERSVLLADPESTLRRVLAFIDEAYAPVVLRPFA